MNVQLIKSAEKQAERLADAIIHTMSKPTYSSQDEMLVASLQTLFSKVLVELERLENK